ncbi:MAG TPA: hypothetical protein VLZ50_08965, partial [Terracidiphilus sp.]|nr:hypothetical protein [Terracidiphilus sp.]
WDFIAYIKGRGILVAAESEFLTSLGEIERDFEKLLYSSAPIKLMICRIDEKNRTREAAQEEANRICRRLEGHLTGTCTYHSPGSVLVVYCVWWSDEQGKNRDISFLLQIEGEISYQSAENKRFEAV